MTCDEQPEDRALLDELDRLANDPTLTDAQRELIVAVLDQDGRWTAAHAAFTLSRESAHDDAVRP